MGLLLLLFPFVQATHLPKPMGAIREIHISKNFDLIFSLKQNSIFYCVATNTIDMLMRKAQTLIVRRPTVCVKSERENRNIQIHLRPRNPSGQFKWIFVYETSGHCDANGSNRTEKYKMNRID